MLKRKTKNIMRGMLNISQKEKICLDDVDNHCVLRISKEVFEKRTRGAPYHAKAMDNFANTLCGQTENINRDEEIQQFLIDEDYLEWLGNKPDTTENMLAYVQECIENDISKEAGDEYKITDNLYALIMSCSFYEDNTDAVIGEEVINELERYFKEIAGEGNYEIYVIPRIFKIEDFIKESERIWDMCETWLDHGVKTTIGEFSTIKGSGSMTVCIPIAVRERYDKMTAGEVDDFIKHRANGRFGRMFDFVPINEMQGLPKGLQIPENLEPINASYAIQRFKNEFSNRAEVKAIFDTLVVDNMVPVWLKSVCS